ncbi:MAG: aspartyl protease [Candidatus Chisholmbacteria bacterium]|nr:aspartyl protease [Candidatus Chisholmbacteria bacterium]
MGLTSLSATIINPANTRLRQQVDFLVDSGAVYSVVDKKILKKIGIKPHGTKRFFLANGQVVERQIGGSVYEYADEKGYAPVIFGEKNDSNLLGTVTLEALGLVLDPLQRKLLKLPLVLGALTR